MSAFAGVIGFGRPVPPDHAARLASALTGEGLGKPVVRRFDHGVFVFRQQVATPEDRWERQPSAGGSSGVLSMFDGRLDNRAQLIADLGQVSTAEAPLPDGELVRFAYERWGADALPRLLGDFAWALWDGRARRLMLARDHSIYRSLYYSRIEGGIAFATGYRPLLALPEVSRDLDEHSVADLLATSPDEDDGTVYRDISWVVSAGRVLADADGLRCDRHWRPEPPPVLRLPRDEDYLDAARELFERAVACRLRVVGPVVVSLSGGHDSSAVAATAARQLAPAPVLGLTMVPVPAFSGPVGGNQYADERPQVEALARLHPNLAVEYLSCAGPQPVENAPAGLFLDSGTPLRSDGNLAWFLPLHHRARALGTPTVLAGNWGNYTFSAKGLSRVAELRRDGDWIGFFRELTLARHHLPPGIWQTLRRKQVVGLFPWLRPLYRAVTRRTLTGLREPHWLRWSAINLEFYRTSGFAARCDRNTIANLDSFGPDGYHQVVRYVTNRSRMQADAAAVVRTQTGTELRDPYADRRVMEFCLSLPMDQFMRGGQPRRLSRTLFADRLPPEILDQPKMGAQNTDWFLRLDARRNEIGAELDRLAVSPLACRLLDVPYLKHLLNTLPADLPGAQRRIDLYQTYFSRALHVGRFLRWYEGGNH